MKDNKMAERTVTVTNKTGLHARPAAMFVKKAQEFASDIFVQRDEKTVSAKSILAIMSLNVNPGTVITIKAEGEDADPAVTALAKLVESFVN